MEINQNLWTNTINNTICKVIQVLNSTLQPNNLMFKWHLRGVSCQK